MKSYEVNYASKVATITKKTTPAEQRMLERMGLKLEMKKEKARPSYRQIEIFISYLENGLEMMEQFETIRGVSLSDDACYEMVLDWFNETFPDYRFAPKIDKDGNLIATVNVVNFADYKKSVEEKERAKALAKAQAELPEAADPQEEEELKKVV